VCYRCDRCYVIFAYVSATKRDMSYVLCLERESSMSKENNPNDHRILYWDDGTEAQCRCGYDPWEELGTDNSGPDEDMVHRALSDHILAVAG